MCVTVCRIIFLAHRHIHIRLLRHFPLHKLFLNLPFSISKIILVQQLTQVDSIVGNHSIRRQHMGSTYGMTLQRTIFSSKYYWRRDVPIRAGSRTIPRTSMTGFKSRSTGIQGLYVCPFLIRRSGKSWNRSESDEESNQEGTSCKHSWGIV